MIMSKISSHANNANDYNKFINNNINIYNIMGNNIKAYQSFII